ncbi:MAG: DUF4091 domain-containing protein [Solobacterium sp.]|nr:DUF4091 domain-containing protein [Solobacterium sp.]
MRKQCSAFIKTVLALIVFLAGMTPLLLQAEEGDLLSVRFAGEGVYEYDSSVHEAYETEGKTSAYLSMWKGETTYLKAAVSAERDTHISVSCDPLTGGRGSETVNVSAGLLKPVSATLGMGIDPYTPHINVDDRVTPETEADLAAGETAFLWITLSAGEISSGTYRGTVHITADHTYDLALEAAVAPLSLSAYEPDVNLWFYPYSSYYHYDALRSGEPFSDAHCEVLQRELALYKDAGGNHVTCTITDEPWSHQTYHDTPSMVTWNVDGGGFLWFDYSQFDRWVSLCEEAGITGQIDCFSILPFDNAITVYSDMGEPSRISLYPGDETWRWYWENFLYSFIAHLDEKGWLERTCLYVDERGIDHFNTAIDFVESIPGGERLKFGAAVNVIPRDTATYDRFDELSISIASVPEGDAEFDAFLSHRRELGLRTTMYNCSTNYPNAFVTSDPCESVWSMQYLGMRGFDGYLRWAFNAWPEDPRNCADNPYFEAGDTFLIYPDEASSASPVPRKSVRLCMIQKGLNDLRKYRILLNQLDPQSASVLEEMAGSLVRCYGTYNAYGAMGAISEGNRRIIASESLRMEAIIQKAALIAALEAQGTNLPSLLDEMKELTQYQP